MAYAAGMIRLSVMYPAVPGSTFDWDYYLGPHVALAHRLLDDRGLIRLEIDRGLAGLPPGTPAPYHAVGHLFFPDLATLQAALAETAAEFMVDERKYANAPGIVQINEVIAL
jgi:uncharacterized protein (TIGR02118 family)